MRHVSKWVGGALGVLLLGSAVIAADESAPEKPARKHAVRLIKPWSELTLTDDQKTKILAIHAKSLEEVKAIHEKEQSEVMALLDDAQKKEAEGLMEKARHHSATTKPGEE